MTFLNVALLAGSLAFVVPLVIHLLNRSRFQVVPWAAMHLLEFSLPQNTRRWEWRSLLLLLVRCLIPIVLALCMARPLWNWWQSRHAGEVDSAVLLLDNSVSMQASLPEPLRNADTQTGFPFETAYQYALREAGNIAARGRANGRFALITLSDEPSQVGAPRGGTARPYGSQAELLSSVERSRFGNSPVDLLQSLQTAIATAQSFRRPAASVVLISDFRASDWEAIGDDALAELKKRMQDTKPPVSLALLQVPVVDTPNNSVHFLADQPTYVRVGQPLEISVIVHNDTPTPSGTLPIIAQVDAADLGSKQVSLPAHGQAQVSFMCRFEQPGQHQVAVRIKDNLTIVGDNVAYMTLSVLPGLKCLLIDDSDAAELLNRDSGFLHLALGGADTSNETGGRPFEVTACSASKMEPAILAETNVIVLANVASLPQEMANAVAERVAAGAYLVLFPGDRLDRNWYTTNWGPRSEHPLLPSLWGDPKQIAAADPNVTVREQAWEHPALRFFNMQGNGQLSRIEFRQYWPLTLESPSASPPQSGDAGTISVPIAWLSTDEPWLVTRSYDRGHVLQCATTCNSQGSNWPLRPSFVPAVQRLLSAPFDNAAVVGEAAARESELKVLPPDRLAHIATALGAQQCDSAEGYLSQMSANASGTELWQPLLWLTVALLVGEVFLQRYLARGPR